MALKTPQHHRSSRAPQHPGGAGLSLNSKIGPIPTTMDVNQETPKLDDHRLYPPEFREMLELNDYRVALVSQSEWAYLQSSVEQSSSVTPPVLMPFSWKELIAGVCEFVRGSNSAVENRVARFADVCVDFIKMEVSRLSGEIVALTNQEYKTLNCFLSNPQRVISREELLNKAWGYQNYPSTRTVDNHVLRLRQKLERDPANPIHFLTVHCVGYKFVP